MKTHITLLFAGFVIVAGSSFAAATNQSDPNNREERLQKYKIKRALCKALVSWLSDGNDFDGAECERLADSLLSLAEPGARSYFTAAQVAMLREKSDKAISIIEDVISKYPDEKATIGTRLPVKIAGQFWMGTIARQSANMTKAKNVYEEILTTLEGTESIEGLEDKGGLTMICNLYLAEIEFEHLKRNDRAVARLEAIAQVKKPVGQFGPGYDIYYGWAAYQHAKISKGKSQALQQLVPFPDMMHAPLLALTQLNLSGITDAPLAFCYGPDREDIIIVDTLFNWTIENTTSSIDRSLARLGYGFDQHYKRNFTKAEKHYSALLQEDSYFSPVAGLYLARCKKAQDKTAEADSILEQVRAKYPGYGSAVAELKESWKKDTPNIN